MPVTSGGLTETQLDALLAGDWLTSGPLRLTETLTAPELGASAALENARRLLAALLEAGHFPVTPNGTLARPALGRLLDVLRWDPPDFPAQVRAEFGPALQERDSRRYGSLASYSSAWV